MSMLRGQIATANEQAKKDKLAAIAAAAGSASFGRSAHLVRSYVLNPYQLVSGAVKIAFIVELFFDFYLFFLLCLFFEVFPVSIFFNLFFPECLLCLVSVLPCRCGMSGV
jgi:hypothetical protein